MNDKMRRFLNSIKIENIDTFDLDFDMVSRDHYDRRKLNMAIVKDRPWDYYLLSQFQDGLNRIDYPYSIHFSYKKRPNGYDALSLFEEWYLSIYHVPHNMILSVENDSVKVEFESEQEQEQNEQALNDYRDFLNFLNYDIEIRIAIVPHDENQGERASDEEIEILTADAVKAIEEEDPTEKEIIDKSELEAMEKEQLEARQNIEASLLKKMKENRKLMEFERKERSEGNYEFYENIASIDSNSGYIDFDGQVFSIEKRSFGAADNYVIGVSDHKNAVYVTARSNRSTLNLDVILKLKIKSNIRIRGKAIVDNFRNQLSILADYIDLLPPDVLRKDRSPEKRVELHLHTQMSAKDATGSIEDYAALAKSMGHKAFAITDHGVVQSFPHAQEISDATGLKILYGSELYMIEDTFNYVMNPAPRILNGATYVVLDLETTGLSSRYDGITEFGAVKLSGGIEVASLDLMINPERKIPKKIIEKTHITDEMVEKEPKFGELADKILAFIGDAIIVTHNAEFDVGFLNESLIKIGRKPLPNPVVDTLSLSRYLFPSASRHSLGALCRNFEVIYDEHKAHRADYDARVLAEVWQAMLVSLTKDNLKLLHSDLKKLQTSKELYKHMRAKHVTCLAKNLAGIKDLYKIISLSHIEYFAGIPKIPRSEIVKHRENLLLGSACFNGEIFDTAKTRSKSELVEKMKFYDYIEVQPAPNYSYLVDTGEVSSNDSIKRLLVDIIDAAKEIDKPVVATGDVHYANPEDKIYRDVYILAKPAGGSVPHPLNQDPYGNSFAHFVNPDQHYRSTDEMLKEFSFLGEEKAKEIVITNTNLIANQIDDMKPVKTTLHKPSIPDSDKILRELCYKTAHEYYGDELPSIVTDRLERELGGIISNGYSVTYYIAHKIIEKANADGFMVGSRGSVGSSFVATMSGITEVNPLPPHYRCPKCRHFELVDDPDIRSGYDLPDKRCPVCGTPLIHDGQNIPFETFLGFNADKVPDIDLNFPRDYQSRAHDYTKVLLGASNVYRAGTIGTVEVKTAFGFAKGYFERSGGLEGVSQADIAMLAQGCVGVKRTTGQHPGGIVVIPTDYDVYDFTPIQYPADELDANWKTTHFEFASMHDTLLKLDLLGHVDPMALKMMGELTGVDPVTIPLNDPKVLSIFSTDKALNRTSNYLREETGALAIPEFGTNFVRGILKETKPKCFADLLVISGLSHGEGVWQGNAQDLIRSKTVKGLRDVIGCRDDIMTYLLSKGVPANLSFHIMEDVRKNRGVKKEFEETMLAHGVPKYYIDSCNKIHYMFPKAHATAYVTMAIRVGYFKIYYPLEFYATFFSVRVEQFDIKALIKGREAVIDRLEEIKTKKANKEPITNKELDLEVTLQIAIEMLERGYRFANIDLYRSDASNFVVDHENKALIAPFTVIDGLGLNAALSVIEARKNGEFLSKEDLLRKTKLNGTNIDKLNELGVLNSLNDTDQLSLFDFSF